MYYIGQICGLVGAGITLIQPQFPKKTQMLICTILVNGLNALNFALIGQFGASVFLCLVAVAQGFVAMGHEIRKTPVTRTENLVFFILYLGFGFLGMVTAKDFTWAINFRNLLELMPIVGAIMLMLSVFADSEQKTRLFLLLNGTSWLVYTVIVGSTAFFTALIAIVSSAIALQKYRVKS